MKVADKVHIRIYRSFTKLKVYFNIFYENNDAEVKTLGILQQNLKKKMF